MYFRGVFYKVLCKVVLDVTLQFWKYVPKSTYNVVARPDPNVITFIVIQYNLCNILK